MILDEIAAATRIRVAKEKEEVSLEEVKAKALSMEAGREFPFEKALKKDGISFICEVKKASPSKGLIAKDFPYLQIAKEYEAAGASAISVLTEPQYFQGSKEYLREIAQEVSIPVLRKDFTVDAYQIYEAKILGASAVLLICAILDEDTLKEYFQLADSLGLSAIVEAHTREEVEMALRAGVRVIGVNNRNLKNFEVDITTSQKLRSLVPAEYVFVSESGIRTPQDIQALREHQVDAVLIGEAFMRSHHKKEELARLRGDEKETRVKMCGMFREEDMNYVNQVKPDFMGFVFAKSSRQVTKEQARIWRKKIDPSVSVVGVFVDETVENVIETAKDGIIDYIQLHGQEDNKMIDWIHHEITTPVIQAFKIRSKEDIRRVRDSHADYYLLDYGKGDGRTFNWSLLEGEEPFAKPVFLAGGIGPENIEEAVSRFHPYAVDMSSSLETDGVKDLEKMKEVIRRIRNV